MITPVPKNYPTLIKDLEMLELGESRRKELARKINAMEASNDEIIEWHYSSDGLRELKVSRMLLGEINPEYRHLATGGATDSILEGNTSAIGGSLLVLRTAFPDYFENLFSEEAYNSFLNIAKQSGISLDQNPIGSVMGYLTYNLLKSNHLNIDINNDTLVQQLLIGADMLRTAKTETAFHQKIYEELADEQKIPRKDRPIFYGHSNTASAIIYDYIAGLPSFNKITNTETMLYTVKGCQQMVASMMRDINILKIIFESTKQKNLTLNFGQIDSNFSNLLITKLLMNMSDPDEILSEGILKEFKHSAVVFLADSIKKVFLGDNNDGLLYKSNYSKKQIRGMLFEPMWQLDFLVLNIINNVHFPNFCPSLTFEDEPKIGYPILNHGFDGTISTSDGLNHIQLKSSKHAAENCHYHPNIKVVYDEKDTDEAEPRRLTAKLDKYTKIFNKLDISPEEAKVLERYVLSSVKKEFLEASSISEQKDGKTALGRAALNYTGLPFEKIVDTRIIEKPFTGLNRKQRRRQAKNIKKRR